ncbi:MAG: glutathione S-transferase family protein [Alphaproteobacteria bacterium]|jgi:glutathione S-transferase|nr:glutathione S-transferase family protein [Alphaproteobacteria bacterium]
MAEPIVFGAAYSVYVRVARLALEEKGVAYRLEEVDIFAGEGPPTAYLERHPFARIPAFEHDGFRLYESGAISRYVDEAFDGPPLMPDSIRGRARANQILSILDNYTYRTLVWDIFVERVRKPQEGRATDEAHIQGALPKVRLCLAALADLKGEGPFLVGDHVSLADLHAAPIFVYFLMAPEGRELMAEQPRLEAWWSTVSERPAMAATRSPLEA